MGIFKNSKKLTTQDLAEVFGDELDVVGESKYPNTFKAVLGKDLQAGSGAERLVSGALMREKNNKRDPNAVKVQVGFRPIGYIPADDAEELAELMDDAKVPTVFVTVRVWGKLDERGVFGAAQVQLP